MIGTHEVFVYPDRDAPTGTPVDIACLLDSVSIRYGRTDTANQPDPASATLDVTIGPGAPLPAIVDIGAWIIIDTVLAGTRYRRFTGRVTDLAIGWDDAGKGTPDAGVGQIIAVSVLADYTRRVVGDEPFPQELDGSRVARVFALAGLTLNPATSDPGTVEIIPRDIDRRAALEVATDTANSAGGLIWETRTGDIRYADSEHRRNAPLALDLDACDILVTPTWLRNISGLVNQISMGYGVKPEAPAEGESTEAPRLYAEAPESVTRFGRYEYSVTTELARLEDAQEAAWLILAQNSYPIWMLQALPVDMAGLSQAETATLLTAELHTLIRVTGIPSTGVTPTSAYAWVEGYTERLAWGIHEIELVVSDYCRTAPPPRWNDVTADVLWDTARGNWNAAACFGPIPSLGRWDDMPANTRWDDYPAKWDEAVT